MSLSLERGREKTALKQLKKRKVRIYPFSFVIKNVMKSGEAKKSKRYVLK
jgi:hypothetical protein